MSEVFFLIGETVYWFSQMHYNGLCMELLRGLKVYINVQTKSYFGFCFYFLCPQKQQFKKAELTNKPKVMI